MVKLKPCICGEDRVHCIYDKYDNAFYIECEKHCGFYFKIVGAENKSKAVKVWNTRPIEDSKDKRIKELEEFARKITEIAQHEKKGTSVVDWNEVFIQGNNLNKEE